jgi:membrane protein
VSRFAPRRFWGTVKYCFEVESHVYAFSIAANVLLSFFPFLLVMIWICRSIGWPAAEEAVYFGMNDIFGPEVEQQIRAGVRWIPNRFAHFNWTSLLLLLFTANGVFEPLEVALNRAWGITQNRSFLKNQLVSMGLIFACGSLTLFSVVLTAINREYFLRMSQYVGDWVTVLGPLWAKAAALPITIATLFLIYWLLPNAKINPRRVLPEAVAVGFALELFKYLTRAVWPWFLRKLQIEYGPFYWAVIVVFLSFLAAMIVLAGAEWAGRDRHQPESDQGTGPEGIVASS